MQAHLRNENLVREAVREILRSGDVSQSPALRKTLVTESKVSDWQLAQTYALGGRGLLTESQQIRGRLLMEGIVDGVSNAFRWMGGKVSSGASSAANQLRQMTRDAVDLTGRVYTALLKEIPNGEQIFEFLSGFAADTAESISKFVTEALKEFGQFLVEKKDEFIKALFEEGASDPGVVTKLKEMKDKALADLKGTATGAGKKIKTFFSLLDQGKIVELMKFIAPERETVGKFVKWVAEVIIKNSKAANKKVGQIGQSLFSGNSGKLILNLLSVVTFDLGREEIINAGINIFTAAKEIKAKSLNMAYRAKDAFKKVLPEMLLGLVGGGNAGEILTRLGFGDPTMVPKLIKKALQLIFNAIKKLAETALTKKILPAVNIDPESKIGKVLTATVMGMLGVARGVASGASGTDLSGG